MRNVFSLREPLIAGIVCTASLSAAFAQTAHRPSDLQLLVRVQTVIRNEPAFAGMTITPSVAHGVVSLNGTVPSQAAKMLASNEAAGVGGVRTVINNLNVATAVPAPIPAPPSVSSAHEPLAASPVSSPVSSLVSRKVTLPPGSVISVRLEDEINTKTAKANDTFRGTTASATVQDGFILIPTGTPVTGRIIDAKQAGHFTGQAQLSIELVSLKLPAPGAPQAVLLVTDPLSNEASGRGKNTAEKTGGGAAVGAIIGALAGGGTGAAIGAASGGAFGAGTNAVTRGKQIDLKAEQLLQFHTAAPLEVTVQLRNGTQVTPPAAGPALETRSEQQ